MARSLKFIMIEKLPLYLESRNDIVQKTKDRIEYIIKNFIRWLDDEKQTISEIDYLDWINTLNISNNTKAGYQCCLRQFIDFINADGYKVLRPEVIKTRDVYSPYIFNNDECKRIVEMVDNYQYLNGKAICEDYTLPMLIRILISTGIRVSEATGLKISDYDQANGVIKIEMSKGKKERLVPISDSLKNILDRYVKKINSYHKDAQYLFPLKDYKRHMEKSHVDNAFRLLFKRYGYIRTNVRFKRDICPHCFRHTFAVHSFKQALDKGYDITDTVPYLSIYMGHKSLKETEKYLKFSNELFPEYMDLFENYSEKIYEDKSE